jgi:hypothetical protein
MKHIFNFHLNMRQICLIERLLDRSVFFKETKEWWCSGESEGISNSKKLFFWLPGLKMVIGVG